MDQNYDIYKNVGKPEIKFEVLVKVLGKGSFGQVFLARKVSTKQLVACKLISKEDIISFLNGLKNYQFAEQAKQKILERLSNEIENTKKMQHPNIVRFEEFSESSNNFYIFLEYCTGGTLEKLIKLRKKIPEDEALIYFQQLAQGCKYLYDKNVIHRDLKPSNILIQDNVMKITDFGFSKALSEEIANIQLNHTPQIGTPLYMSPQVIGLQNYSIKADCWSLGCIFYEMLYGKPPWYHSMMDRLQNMILNDDLQFPNDIQVSEKMKNLLIKMLQKSEVTRIDIIQVLEYLV